MKKSERNDAVQQTQSLKRSGTPRPVWESLEIETPVMNEESSKISTIDRVNQLIHQISDLKKSTSQNYIVVPQPQPDDVPVFLKTEKELIHNRRMSPDETAEIIKGFHSCDLLD